SVSKNYAAVEAVMINLAFVADFGLFSYLIIFALLAVSGLGFSFGEEIILLLTGYLSYKGILIIPIAIVVAFLGILAADSLGFHFGRNFLRSFPRLLKWRLLKKSSMQKLKDARYLFASRFIPNARMLVPIAAGFYGLSWKRFFRCNVFAAALFAPGLVALGLYAGPQISWLVSFFATFSEILFVLLGVLIIFFVIRFLRSNA
ncbi:DedA family protein, partial [Candidatus Woesearchaeota archaeon]|nr:DedA family protein [Candidatus Woesearchaeota archaeon]